jgi:hypothetical protein
MIMSRPPLPAQSPALVYKSIQFDMSSQISGRTYRVFAFKPDCLAPVLGLSGGGGRRWEYGVSNHGNPERDLFTHWKGRTRGLCRLPHGGTHEAL